MRPPFVCDAGTITSGDTSISTEFCQKLKAPFFPSSDAATYLSIQWHHILELSRGSVERQSYSTALFILQMPVYSLLRFPFHGTRAPPNKKTVLSMTHWRNAWIWELGEELMHITRSQGSSSGNTCLQSLSRIPKTIESHVLFECFNHTCSATAAQRT